MKKTILFIYDFAMRTLEIPVLYISIVLLFGLQMVDYKMLIVVFLVAIASGISTKHNLEKTTKELEEEVTRLKEIVNKK